MAPRSKNCFENGLCHDITDNRNDNMPLINFWDNQPENSNLAVLLQDEDNNDLDNGRNNIPDTDDDDEDDNGEVTPFNGLSSHVATDLLYKPSNMGRGGTEHFALTLNKVTRRIYILTARASHRPQLVLPPPLNHPVIIRKPQVHPQRPSQPQQQEREKQATGVVTFKEQAARPPNVYNREEDLYRHNDYNVDDSSIEEDEEKNRMICRNEAFDEDDNVDDFSFEEDDENRMICRSEAFDEDDHDIVDSSFIEDHDENNRMIRRSDAFDEDDHSNVDNSSIEEVDENSRILCQSEAFDEDDEEVEDEIKPDRVSNEGDKVNMPGAEVLF